MDLIRYFDRTVVINLPSRRDRLRLITRELRSVGAELGTERIQLFPAVRPSEPAGFPSIGARGCFMSHLTVLKQALVDGMSNLLILEDDLQFSRSFRTSEEPVLDAIRSRPWDICYLGHGIQPPEDVSQGVFEARGHIQNAHFLAFNRPCIERVVPFLETVLKREPGHPDGGPMHVDGAFSTFRAQQGDICTLLAAPSLGGQRSSYSDIAARRWYDKAPIVRQMTTAARGMKSWLRN